MLIARALPIMRVYIKPGGQRSYSGHCINLPQNVIELAMPLPRYPKDLAVIIVKAKGRENTFKDVTQALKYRSVTDIVRPIHQTVRRREETTGHSVRPK